MKNKLINLYNKINKLYLFIFCIVISFLLGISVSQAQNSSIPALCLDSSELVDQLTKQYNEFPVLQGLSAAGTLFSVFESNDPENHSWSVVLSRPEGISCFIVGGKDELVHLPLPEYKSPGVDN